MSLPSESLSEGIGRFTGSRGDVFFDVRRLPPQHDRLNAPLSCCAGGLFTLRPGDDAADPALEEDRCYFAVKCTVHKTCKTLHWVNAPLSWPRAHGASEESAVPLCLCERHMGAALSYGFQVGSYPPAVRAPASVSVPAAASVGKGPSLDKIDKDQKPAAGGVKARQSRKADGKSSESSEEDADHDGAFRAADFRGVDRVGRRYGVHDITDPDLFQLMDRELAVWIAADRLTSMLGVEAWPGDASNARAFQSVNVVR